MLIQQEIWQNEDFVVSYNKCADSADQPGSFFNAKSED
jgi:hypothetical protein